MRLIVATHNLNKVREIGEMLPGWEIVAEDSAAEETEPTFRGNALLKARALKPKHPGTWILADDSGLEVRALGGAPGVRSARYSEGIEPESLLPGQAAPTRTELNNALLLKNLAAQADRRAQFTCAIALIDPDGRERTVEGHCPGTILAAPAGAGGFGYDPLFRPDGYEQSFAELSPAAKNAISHRGRALKAAKAIMLGI